MRACAYACTCESCVPGLLLHGVKGLEMSVEDLGLNGAAVKTAPARLRAGYSACGCAAQELERLLANARAQAAAAEAEVRMVWR